MRGGDWVGYFGEGVCDVVSSGRGVGFVSAAAAGA